MVQVAVTVPTTEGVPQGFQCPRCSKSYSTRGTLTRHMSYECGVEPKFQCPLCRRRFSHKFNLHAHMICHQNSFLEGGMSLLSR
ncbi:hypothetical protein J6590_002311 [Homalodisca vitripennis]|nr:hypothetical protein J6590_002311 [Homalodisca vitripennis]